MEQVILTPELRKIVFPAYIGSSQTHYKIIDENSFVIVNSDKIEIYNDQESVRIILGAWQQNIYKSIDSNTFKVAYAKTLSKINSLINN